MSKRRVLLIGWDAADWKLINPLLESGEAPAIERMIESGVMGNLATLQPVLSPMLWNSIASGKRPSKHGIHGFTEVNPHTRTVNPVLSTSRKVKAIWNILSQEGLKAHVVNWFASHPAEKINGVCLTNFLSQSPKDWDDKWAVPKDSVHPAEKADTFGDLRLHPKELTGDILQMFCPLAHEIDQTKDSRLKVLASLIAEALTVHNFATYILEHEEWDFLAVYYGAIDHFCHAFMHYHPPQMAGVTDQDFRWFKDVVPNAYRLHDRMLARLLQLAGDDTTVIVCSDHGFHSDQLRPTGTPAVPAGPAYWHRDQGILMMQGPNIARDQLIHGANLLDITPTILQAMGMPIGRDMDGRPLIEAFENVDRIDTIESWESRAGEYPDGMHSETSEVTSEQANEILEQFIALGYIERPDSDTDKAVAQTRRESRWNLARSHIHAGEIDLAIPILESLVDEMPERRDFTLTLANCLQHYGLADEAEQLILAAMPEREQNDAAMHVLAELALTRGDTESALAYLKNLEALDQEMRAAGASLTTNRYLTLGATFAKLRDWSSAIENYRKAIEIDPDLPRAHLGMAQCRLRLRDYAGAVDSALTAVELEHSLGYAHFVLARALLRTEHFSRSIDACHMALKYMPGNDRVHRTLAFAYRRLGRNENQAEMHQKQAAYLRTQRHSLKSDFEKQQAEIRNRIRERLPRLKSFYAELQQKEAEKAEAEANPPEAKAGTARSGDANGDEYLIVSGLPRSGTSLMMSMLRAGGMSVMTDGVRKADEDNPEGYLEWEEIKKIKSHPELMDKARGKVAKVISMLLPDLPRDRRYKVIFVLRPVEEIAASQAKMIQRRGTKGANLDEEQLLAGLLRHRNEIIGMLNALPMEVLPIRYHRILEDPDAVIDRLVRFLGEGRIPNPQAMASVIRKDLYRNRRTSDDAAETEGFDE